MSVMKIINTFIAKVLEANNVTVPQVLDSLNCDDRDFKGCGCDYNCDWDFEIPESDETK